MWNFQCFFWFDYFTGYRYAKGQVRWHCFYCNLHPVLQSKKIPIVYMLLTEGVFCTSCFSWDMSKGQLAPFAPHPRGSHWLVILFQWWCGSSFGRTPFFFSPSLKRTATARSIVQIPRSRFIYQGRLQPLAWKGRLGSLSQPVDLLTIKGSSNRMQHLLRADQVGGRGFCFLFSNHNLEFSQLAE